LGPSEKVLEEMQSGLQKICEHEKRGIFPVAWVEARSYVYTDRERTPLLFGMAVAIVE